MLRFQKHTAHVHGLFVSFLVILGDLNTVRHNKVTVRNICDILHICKCITVYVVKCCSYFYTFH